MSSSTYPNVYHGTLLDEIIHEQKLSRDLVKKAAREVFAIIKEGLLRDGVVRINHFGSFKLRRVAARKGRNPRTGESITIPGHAKVIFTPCKALREMIDPVHAKPIPVPTPATETAQTKKPTREAVQPLPELVPEPALFKIESEASTLIERVSDFEAEQVTEGRKRGGREKLIYLGIAVTIIAVIAIKSMPPELETQPQQITAPPVTELQIKPMQVVPAPVPVIESPTEKSTVASVAEPEAEAELAQIIATQSEQQRVELETVAEQSLPLYQSEAVSENGEEVAIERVDVPAVAAVTEPSPVEQAQAVTKPLFFAEHPYKLQAGNSLWRLSNRFYTEPLYWPHIFYANSATITDPDKLREGRTITMPTLEGRPGSLTTQDRDGIAEGYFLVYTFYKKSGHPDAFFALLEAKRYSAEVVEAKRHTLTLSMIENIMLDQQEVVAKL